MESPENETTDTIHRLTENGIEYEFNSDSDVGKLDQAANQVRKRLCMCIIESTTLAT
jgi:hypothetical protein